MSRPRSRRAEEAPVERTSFVWALDRQLLDSVLRFLTATGTGVDRRVLATIYLREMAYRAVQREQFSRLLELAANQPGATR